MVRAARIRRQLPETRCARRTAGAGLCTGTRARVQHPKPIPANPRKQEPQSETRTCSPKALTGVSLERGTRPRERRGALAASGARSRSRKPREIGWGWARKVGAANFGLAPSSAPPKASGGIARTQRNRIKDLGAVRARAVRRVRAFLSSSCAGTEARDRVRRRKQAPPRARTVPGARGPPTRRVLQVAA